MQIGEKQREHMNVFSFVGIMSDHNLYPSKILELLIKYLLNIKNTFYRWYLIKYPLKYCNFLKKIAKISYKKTIWIKTYT